MKNMTEQEARRLVAIGIKRGWIRPAPQEPPPVLGRPTKEREKGKVTK